MGKGAGGGKVENKGREVGRPGAKRNLEPEHA